MNLSPKIAIATDSNSGILPAEAKELGVFLMPMPFLINGEPYFENMNLSQSEFYRLLANNANVSTSQPSIGDLADFWTEILENYDSIVYIPMSSGLSQSCATATNIANEFNGRVFVVDNRRISVTQKNSVLDALILREQGKTAEEIVEHLTQTAEQSSIYIAVDTMKYLKKGGRVTPAAAMIGSILKIKPVLQLQGQRLDKFALARSLQKAKDTMKAAIKTDLETRFAEFLKAGEMILDVAYTENDTEALLFVEELKTAFPLLTIRHCDPLPLSVSCHIGSGALAVAATHILK